MTSNRCRGISRRDFLHASGVGLGIAACDNHIYGQEAPTGFLPCIDYPIRRGPDDPPTPTPVEYALELQGNPSPSAPRMPTGRGAAAPSIPENTPVRAGAPARAPARMAAKNRWQVQVLKIAFQSGTSQGLIQRVMRIASQWSEFTKIPFERSSSSNAEIRVAFRPGDGHWSYVGIESVPSNVRGNSMNLAISERSLDTNPYDTAVVLHEFGHALGCIHEHQSPGQSGIEFDPEKTINYFRVTYQWPRQMTIDNVLTRYNAGSLLRFSDFDPKSIMLYQYPASITKNKKGTEQNLILSQTDMEFISKLYGQTPPTPSGKEQPKPTETASQSITVDGPPIIGAITPNQGVNNYLFEITSNRTYVLATAGYTQVDLRLFKDETEVDLKDKVSTPDLVNQIAKITLATGKYRLEVRHLYPNGVGEYGLRVVSVK